MQKTYFTQVLIGIALTLSGSLVARAQATFRPGYVVPLAGDTLRGEVQELSELRNSLACRFRPGPAATPTDYAPTAARAYGFTGSARYEARLVPPADSARPTPTLLFVEVLVSGAAQLYTCRDHGHTRYFVAVGPAGARLRELAERRVKTFSNGFEAYETRSLYRDTLAAALRACPAVQLSLPRLPFQQAALGRVITRYNECVGGPAAVSTRLAPRARGPVLSLLGGYQYGSLSFGSGSLITSFNHQGPVGGLALGLALPHTRQTVSVRLEALYSAEQYKQTQFNQSYLSLPVQLRYTLLRNRVIRPFAEAGVVYSYLLFRYAS
ncbi:hypothetical protein A0257_03780 [Hymenobacter psoromatis]|nr:hypothetical protein A0257_03780 [Hymenobacter psoromatis]